MRRRPTMRPCGAGIGADVKAAYYDYFYFDRAIQTTNRNKELLEKLSKIAEARLPA